MPGSRRSSRRRRTDGASSALSGTVSKVGRHVVPHSISTKPATQLSPIRGLRHKPTLAGPARWSRTTRTKFPFIRRPGSAPHQRIPRLSAPRDLLVSRHGAVPYGTSDPGGPVLSSVLELTEEAGIRRGPRRPFDYLETLLTRFRSTGKTRAQINSRNRTDTRRVCHKRDDHRAVFRSASRDGSEEDL